jgi:hypothetical protein
VKSFNEESIAKLVRRNPPVIVEDVAVYVFAHMVGSLLVVEIVSVNSANAVPVAGYNCYMSQTARVIVVTLATVTVVPEQGLTTFKIKLEGPTSEVLPYVMPFTITVAIWIV